MLTPDQHQALTWLACETRRTTHGCGDWDKPGTHKAIGDICGTWTFATALDHVIAHARDPKARTPFAMRGTKPNLEPTSSHKHPMRAGDPDECRLHRGQHRDHCSGCAADRLTHDPTPPRVPPPGDVIDEDTGRKITGRELFDIKRQELDLRHALTPSIEEEA